MGGMIQSLLDPHVADELRRWPVVARWAAWLPLLVGSALHRVLR